jgi:hypothetical protein
MFVFHLTGSVRCIRMDHRETGWEGVKWMHLAQGRDQWWALVNVLMNLWVS